ncbi:MAG: hypothetical protein AAB871_01410 [Patescibacteria group bacterium]
MFKNRKKLQKWMVVFAVVFILSMLIFTLIPFFSANQAGLF